MAPQRCFSCGGSYPASDGPTHRYMLSSPGCWAAYGTLLAREYQDTGLFAAVHRLTVDAYALQHPGDAAVGQARQSVWVHYAALHLAMEEALPPDAIPRVMQRLVGRPFPDLPPFPATFATTLADVLRRPASEHVHAVRDWAQASFAAWADLAAPTRDLLRRVT